MLSGLARIAALAFAVADTTTPDASPVGQVEIESGSTVLGTGTLDNTGHVTISLSLPVGVYSITAVYPGNSQCARYPTLPPIIAPMNRLGPKIPPAFPDP